MQSGCPLRERVAERCVYKINPIIYHIYRLGQEIVEPVKYYMFVNKYFIKKIYKKNVVAVESLKACFRAAHRFA